MLRTAFDSIALHERFIHLPIDFPENENFTQNERIHLENNVNTNSLYFWCGYIHENIA